MVRFVRLIAAALLALTPAPSAVEAQTKATNPTTTHSRPVHGQRVERPKEVARQITVRLGTPSWLTLGNGASVGRGDDYVTSTFDQPSVVEGTFSGYRGRERVINQYGAPGTPLFRF